MNDKTIDIPRPPGKTTIAPDVLLTIAKLSTLEIDGVSHMAPIPGGVSWIPKRSQSDGVRLQIEDDRVYMDIYVVLRHNVNVREVSRNIQREVARAITDMVGMEIGRVNLHIEDIDYSVETRAEA